MKIKTYITTASITLAMLLGVSNLAFAQSCAGNDYVIKVAYLAGADGGTTRLALVQDATKCGLGTNWKMKGDYNSGDQKFEPASD